MLKITTTSIFVNDQMKALDFYTNILGFELKDNIPVGEFSWITIVTKGQAKGTELLLEPNNHPAAKAYQEALYKDGIPGQMFGVDNLEEEYQRLSQLGVIFTMEPSTMDGFKMAIFEDTCGNLVQIVEKTQ